MLRLEKLFLSEGTSSSTTLGLGLASCFKTGFSGYSRRAIHVQGNYTACEVSVPDRHGALKNPSGYFFHRSFSRVYIGFRVFEAPPIRGAKPVSL